MQRLFFTLTCMFLLVGASMSFAAQYEVLVINADSEGEANEAPVVMSKTDIAGNTFSFTQLNIGPGSNRPPSDAVVLSDAIGADVNLSDYQIIWLTWNGPGHDGSYFFEGVEDDFLSWVENGGFIYIAAFDDNFTDADGNQIGGWMPIDEHPATISNTGDSELTLTAEGEATGIFDGVDLSGLVLDDNFANTAPAYTILATRDDNSEPAAIQLDYGAGAYIEVCVDARSTFPAAEPMVENLLAYMAELSAAVTSVQPADKLSAIWGSLKSE